MFPEESDHFAKTTPENIIPTNMLAALNHAVASVGGNAITTAVGNARKPGRLRNRAGNSPRSGQECNEFGGSHEEGPYGGKGCVVAEARVNIRRSTTECS